MYARPAHDTARVVWREGGPKDDDDERTTTTSPAPPVIARPRAHIVCDGALFGHKPMGKNENELILLHIFFKAIKNVCEETTWISFRGRDKT